MRVRGVVALSTLVAAMACGGRTRSVPDERDPVDRAGTTSSGGQASRGGGASGGSGQVPVAGSTSSGGIGPCLCIGLGCAEGFVWVPDPNVCCGGQCVSGCDDMACTDIGLSCDPGMHVGTLPDECCPLCVPDNPPPCDVAMQLYRDFRKERLSKYRSAGCEGGCSMFGENNRCATTCGTSIPAAFRDSIEEELTRFAEQTCSACPKSFPTPCPAPPPLSCIDQICEESLGPQ